MNDIIILSLLLEGPKHGYDLKQEAAMFSSEQQLHNNTIYPLLKRFLKSDWIILRLKARREEQLLEAEFGAGYIAYRAHTGSILPRIAHV